MHLDDPVSVVAIKWVLIGRTRKDEARPSLGAVAEQAQSVNTIIAQFRNYPWAIKETADELVTRYRQRIGVLHILTG